MILQNHLEYTWDSFSAIVSRKRQAVVPGVWSACAAKVFIMPDSLVLYSLRDVFSIPQESSLCPTEWIFTNSPTGVRPQVGWRETQEQGLCVGTGVIQMWHCIKGILISLFWFSRKTSTLPPVIKRMIPWFPETVGKRTVFLYIHKTEERTWRCCGITEGGKMYFKLRNR